MAEFQISLQFIDDWLNNLWNMICNVASDRVTMAESMTISSYVITNHLQVHYNAIIFFQKQR